MTENWDVTVIGGGAAGLSAALMLVRARRRVVVLDGGKPRNGVAAHMHGVLGHDGRPPLDLLADGRREIESYGGVIVAAEATGAARDGDLFTIEGSDGVTRRSRAVIVATGLRDRLPELPGLAEQWGSRVVVCPYCDGWEVRDGRIGVLATGPHSVHQVQLLRQWSADVTWLGAPPADPDDRDGLAARDITIEDAPLASVVAEGVRTTDGRLIELDRIFLMPGMEPQDEVLRQLGAERADGPMGSFVPVDATGKTSVPGLYAAGNVVNPGANVPVAMGAGAMAGGMVNAELIQGEVRRARAATPGERFWEKRYRDADPAWGRNPNVVTAALIGEYATTPGRALDLGCGHGGDALWLAAQGWDVTAVDVSATALARVRDAAAEQGSTVATERHDLSETFPAGTFDLVTASYFQTPVTFDRAAALKQAAAALNPGGVLILVDHASFAPWSWRSDDHPGFPSAAETLAGFHPGDGWETLRADAPERVATGPDGQTAPVLDNVIVLRRTA